MNDGITLRSTVAEKRTVHDVVEHVWKVSLVKHMRQPGFVRQYGRAVAVVGKEVFVRRAYSVVLNINHQRNMHVNAECQVIQRLRVGVRRVQELFERVHGPS